MHRRGRCCGRGRRRVELAQVAECFALSRGVVAAAGAWYFGLPFGRVKI